MAFATKPPPAPPEIASPLLRCLVTLFPDPLLLWLIQRLIFSYAARRSHTYFDVCNCSQESFHFPPYIGTLSLLNSHDRPIDRPNNDTRTIPQGGIEAEIIVPQRTSAMELLFILAALAVVLPGLYMFTASVVQSRLPTIKNKRICLLIAHPDDEAMFFAPTVLALTRPDTGNHVKILCLSTGMSRPCFPPFQIGSSHG